MEKETSHLLIGLKEFFNDVLFRNLPSIIVALLVLWIGWKLIKWLDKLLLKICTKKNLDVSLNSFLRSIIIIALKVLLIITVAGMIGIQMTSFIAILGAAGLAIGMALQGTLQNFAGGVIILLLKPYKVGDYIEQGGISGIVKEIQVFNTLLITLDNKVIVVPNTQLATNTLTNYTRSEKRRVDVNVGIAYGEDINKARKVLIDLAMSHPDVLKDEADAPAVAVLELGASSINLQLRAWTKTENYWGVMGALTQGTYETLKENQIEIPFDQLQVHINKD